MPTLRGGARRWLRNASGLTWFGAGNLLFSEIKTGLHMAIVRARESRAEYRSPYLPPHQGGHGSPILRIARPFARAGCGNGREGCLASLPLAPNRGGWLQSNRAVKSPLYRRRLVAGRAMDNFSADAGDGFHIWRQRFPDGSPEQVTSGPTGEQGLAVAPDGKSLITAVGLVQRSVWFHDASGERQISLEGYTYFPLLSADGRKVCFRVTRGAGSGTSPSELWMVELGSGQKHRLFPGQLVTGYDVSRDDRVVAAVLEREGHTGVWVAWLDGREPPRRIPHADGDTPKFGRDGEILFRVAEKNTGVVYRILENGERREKIARVNGMVFGTVSPDGEWLSAIGMNNSQMTMFSTSGKPSFPLYPYSQSSRLRWSQDGRRAYLSIHTGGFCICPRSNVRFLSQRVQFCRRYRPAVFERKQKSLRCPA